MGLFHVGIFANTMILRVILVITDSKMWWVTIIDAISGAKWKKFEKSNLRNYGKGLIFGILIEAIEPSVYMNLLATILCICVENGFCIPNTNIS